MCNCGKPKPSTPKPANGGGVQQFALVTATGTRVFGSRLEADAENVRLGRTGRVEPR